MNKASNIIYCRLRSIEFGNWWVNITAFFILYQNVIIIDVDILFLVSIYEK